MRCVRIVGLCFVAMLATSVFAVAPALATYGVMAWGENQFGQLGNGTTTDSDVPVAVSGLSDVTAISSTGYKYSLALSKGKVEGWGTNLWGDLGTPTGPETCHSSTDYCSRIPVEVGGLSEVAAISAGGEHATALLKKEGAVMAWGQNQFGELGNGTTEQSAKPVAVSGLGGVSAISAGFQHNLALLHDGTVMAWGNNEYGQLGIDPSKGPETCATGETARPEAPCSRTPVVVSGLKEVTAISTGYKESLALLSNGEVMAFGENNYGQLGNGTAEYSEAPQLVCAASTAGSCPTGPYLSEVVAISAGYYYSLALLRNGTVVTWGWNREGTLGVGTEEGPEKCPGKSNGGQLLEQCSRSPVVAKNLSGVSAALASTTAHTPLALLSNGTVMAWGENGSAGQGQLGIGTTKGPEKCSSPTDYCARTPVAVRGLADVAAIAAGGDHGLAEVPAAAPPEFGRCIKVTAGLGRYENAGCTKQGGEKKYEWYPGVIKTGFTAIGGTAVLETIDGKTRIVCKAESAKGEESGTNRLVNVTLTFSGCEVASFFGLKCSTGGAQEGEIVTKSLRGVLGWENKATQAAALDLSPTSGPGQFMEFSCHGIAVSVSGSVIAPIHAASTGKMSSKLIVNFRATKGRQTPDRLEGVEKDVLEIAFGELPFEQAGLTLGSTQTREEAFEINVVV